MSNARGPHGRTSVITVESVRDPDGHPVCLLSYCGRQSYPPVEDIRATALDLVVAAADAEALVLLLNLGLPAPAVIGFAEDLLRRRGRTSYGMKSTFSVAPVASSKTRQGWVRLSRPSGRADEGLLTPDEARVMAGNWFEVATGTEADQLLAEALRTCTSVTDQETADLYAYMARLREKSRPDSTVS